MLEYFKADVPKVYVLSVAGITLPVMSVPGTTMDSVLVSPFVNVIVLPEIDNADE